MLYLFCIIHQNNSVIKSKNQRSNINLKDIKNKSIVSWVWLTLSVSPLLHRFATRLVGIKENAKFQKNDPKDTQVSGLKSVVDNAKQRHNVKYVLSLTL